MIAHAPMSWPRLVVGALLRVVVVPLLAYAVMRAVDALSGPVVGANIGAGLAGLLAGLVAVLAWAVVDGRAAGWVAVGPWALAGLLGGIAYAVREGSWAGLIAMGLVPVCVAVAGVVGGVAVGVALGQAQSRGTRSG